MLASEDDVRARDAPKFNNANEIVELVVLTADELFLQTLRDAVGRARRLWHVPSAEKVSDLLVAGEVGILVLDVQTLNEPANIFISQIKRQFPDLVVVAAGNREGETSLAVLISAGIVYRYIHKPVSPGRAKLFAEAAVRKYLEQRKHSVGARPAARGPMDHSALLIGCVLAACLVIVLAWFLHRDTRETLGQPEAILAAKPVDPPLLANAAAALAANRLTEPAGDNALELYQRALTRDPGDAAARAGLAEVHERVLARAENALLEERLDEASVAIDAARRAGVESGRIAFLTAQLAKSRERQKTVPAGMHVRDGQRAGNLRPGEPRTAALPVADAAGRALSLAAERIADGHLADPERDSARFYVMEALRIAPNSEAAQQAKQSLSIALLTEVRSAIDRRDFEHAARWLESANGIATPSNLASLQQSLQGARRQADSDSWDELLKNAATRLQQDRLIEPANDSAKYYLMTLRGVDPANPGLAPALQDLGSRLIAKARRALNLEQYDAARSWLNAAASVGYSPTEVNDALAELDAAQVRHAFLSDVVAANELKLQKNVPPEYPRKAEEQKVQGWVELDFTVADSGAVKDIAVHAANPVGVFEESAIAALSQWRYKPVLRDGKPAPQRARIRIRFSLTP